MSQWQFSRPLLIEQLETRALLAADMLHVAHDPMHATREFSLSSSRELRSGEFSQLRSDPRDFGPAEFGADIHLATRRERGGEFADRMPGRMPGRTKTMDQWEPAAMVVSIPTATPSITSILFVTKPVATQLPARWADSTQSSLVLAGEGSNDRSNSSIVPARVAPLSTLTLVVQTSSGVGRLQNSSLVSSNTANSNVADTSSRSGSPNAVARSATPFSAVAVDVDRLQARSAAAGNDADERALPTTSIAAQPLTPQTGIAGTFAIPKVADDAFSNAIANRQYIPRNFNFSSAVFGSVSLEHLRHVPDSTEIEEPWELSPSTLRELRSLTLQTEQAKATDAVIAMWFDGRGGLIDLSPGSEPLLRTQAVDQVIDVGLEAIVGQHRAMELMAATTEQPKDTDDIRLAVLQAIARANRDTAPVAGDSDNLKPSFGVSGMAILAGTAALAARRKRPQPFLSKHLLDAEQQ